MMGVLIFWLQRDLSLDTAPAGGSAQEVSAAVSVL